MVVTIGRFWGVGQTASKNIFVVFQNLTRGVKVHQERRGIGIRPELSKRIGIEMYSPLVWTYLLTWFGHQDSSPSRPDGAPKSQRYRLHGIDDSYFAPPPNKYDMNKNSTILIIPKHSPICICNALILLPANSQSVHIQY